MKKAEHRRIDAFELWCWRRLLRVPWTARRSNQSFLKSISPEFPLEGLMLKMKLQYFGHLMQRADSLEKTLMLRKIEGGRRRGQQRMKWLDDLIDSRDMSLNKVWDMVKDREVWCAAVHGVTESDTTEQQQQQPWILYCKFSFSLKFIPHLQINAQGVLSVVCRAGNKLSCQRHVF